MFTKTGLLAAASAALLALVAAGCRRAPAPPASPFNQPATREDARAVMRAVDAEAAAHRWEPQVLREVRRRMTGRLLSAGLSEEEIAAWIESPLRDRTAWSRSASP